MEPIFRKIRSASFSRKAISILLSILAPAVRAEIVQSFTKTPFEAFAAGVDFGQVVGSDSMAIVSVTAIDTRTNGDATALLIGITPPAIQLGTDRVIYMVQGGLNGETYQVSVKVQDTVTGALYQGDELVTVNQT